MAPRLTADEVVGQRAGGLGLRGDGEHPRGLLVIAAVEDQVEVADLRELGLAELLERVELACHEDGPR